MKPAENRSIQVVKVPSVQVVLIRDGKREGTIETFLGHRIAGGFSGQWGCPGGKIDANEMPQDAARRELLEETGIELQESDKGRLVFIRHDTSSTIRNNGNANIQYDYEFNIYVLNANGMKPSRTSPEEYDEMKWMEIQEALKKHQRLIQSNPNLPPDKIPNALTPKMAETVAFLLQFHSVKQALEFLGK